MWPKTSRDLNDGERDGQIWGKAYGDAIVPKITEEQLANQNSWSAITAACATAADTESHRLRSAGRSDGYCEAWKNSATSSFVNRTQSLHTIARTNS